MCNAHEILWRVSWWLKVASQYDLLFMKYCFYMCNAHEILFLLFDIFQYDLLFMQKSAFLACEFCVGSFFGQL
jgi:hypothetical protein